MSEKSVWKPAFVTRQREDLTDAEARALLCELCHHFYHQGWASGTGGGVSVRNGERIFMAPSGVQKERMLPEDIFVLNREGEVIEPPQTPGLKVSACRPLFLHAYTLRNAGAVIHSHGIYAMLATLLYEKNFVITNQEMLKGIEGVGAFDHHEVPIIANTAYEEELTNSLEEAIRAYPKAQAVLVKGHGVYIWGRDWMHAKAQAECYHYLFEVAVKLHQMGLSPAHGGLA